MKKKKLLSLIALGLVLAYFAGAIILFDATESIFTTRYQNFADRAKDYDSMSGYKYKDTFDINEYAERLVYESSMNYHTFPYAAAVFDKEGNIIARTGSMLKYTVYADDDNYYFFCNLDPYLTDEMKKSITDMQGKRSYLLVYKMDYNIENGKLIPIKLVLRDYYAEDNFAPENMLTLSFSDEKAQHSVINDYTKNTDFSLSIFFVNIDEEHYNYELYNKINRRLESSAAKDEAKSVCASSGGGGSTGSVNFERSEEIEIDGERYCFYQISRRSGFIEPLVSDQFRSFLWSELLIFLILGAVIMIAASKIYDKNKQLENARIAFTGAAAHELKTPLAVISNQCECILEDIAPEKNKEYVSSIYDEALRMNRLVVSLLQYNRVSVLNKISKEKSDLAELARTETEKYDSLFIGKNITVEINTESSEISCNPELLSLVIDNFLSNAAKHTPQNGRVEINVKKGILSVYNSGSQISFEDSQHIWNEFYREDKARTSGGNSTGMGLAMCKKILELHGYRYGFNNADDGVEFYFFCKIKKPFPRGSHNI